MNNSEAIALMKSLSSVFDLVRLVDVMSSEQYLVDEQGKLSVEPHQCYAAWNKNHRCENCVSAKAFSNRARMTKYEFIGTDAYLVVAKFVEIEGRSLVLEIVLKISDNILFGAIGKEQLAESIMNYNRKLYTDPLTGCYNREYYEEQLKSIQQMSALAMVDIDRFKEINDRYGHAAGDAALRLTVDTLRANIRSKDSVIRYGGDEFLLVFQSMPPEVLPAKLESLRAAVEQARSIAYPELRLTVSIGGSSTNDIGPDRIECADKRMYRAKQQKNSVCCE